MVARGSPRTGDHAQHFDARRVDNLARASYIHHMNNTYVVTDHQFVTEETTSLVLTVSTGTDRDTISNDKVWDAVEAWLIAENAKRPGWDEIRTKGGVISHGRTPGTMRVWMSLK